MDVFARCSDIRNPMMMFSRTILDLQDPRALIARRQRRTYFRLTPPGIRPWPTQFNGTSLFSIPEYVAVKNERFFFREPLVSRLSLRSALLQVDTVSESKDRSANQVMILSSQHHLFVVDESPPTLPFALDILHELYIGFEYQLLVAPESIESRTFLDNPAYK